MTIVDKRFRSIGDVMFLQAFNHRLGTSNLTATELLYTSHKQGMTRGYLPTIVEQDSWTYKTSRNGVDQQGPAMVCCVFVCHLWKSAGLFGNVTDQINCAEFTNWDTYSLNIFDVNQIGQHRPQACQAADPENPLCQLTGRFTLNLNDFNTRSITPHMAEQCPSLAPLYRKPAQC